MQMKMWMTALSHPDVQDNAQMRTFRSAQLCCYLKQGRKRSLSARERKLYCKLAGTRSRLRRWFGKSRSKFSPAHVSSICMEVEPRAGLQNFATVTTPPTSGRTRTGIARRSASARRCCQAAAQDLQTGVPMAPAGWSSPSRARS